MTRYFVTWLLLFYSIITLHSQNKQDTYKLLTDKSAIIWEGKKLLGTHTGNVKFTSGTLQVNNININGGEFTVDMTTITDTDLDDKEYNAKLVNHLKSEDFFNIAKYPKSYFKITKAEPYSDIENKNINFKIYGEMKIKGIKNPIEFPAIIRFDNDGIFARAKFTIDRTKWKIKYKSASIFSDLGDKFIYDDIGFEMNLYFEK
ncbi:MAG: YceI family protein [Bacteroidetes bacterium]|nr:MAG: YceI family protein [Bacteroidota bacterium]